MHFDDLQPCRYHPGHLDAASWMVPLRAIGWLEHPYQFEVGLTPEPLVARLAVLLDQTREHFSHHRFRGAHDCSLCEAAGRFTGGVGWSQENLVIPGASEVYAAPGAIVHYISDHGYRPPAAFLQAIASCPDCGSDAYFDALRHANAGVLPPIESSEQFSRRLRLQAHNSRAFHRALGVPITQATRTQVIAAGRSVWPDVVVPNEAHTIELGGVTIVFDDVGRVVDVRE